MLQEWNYYFTTTMRWRNLRKITVAQVQGPSTPPASCSCGPVTSSWPRTTCTSPTWWDPPRDVRCRVLRAPLGVRPRRTKELMLTGDASTSRGHRLGMVSKIFPVDDLEERALA